MINLEEKRTHFVYPYIIPDDPKFGWELKYSLRSIYKNFRGPFDITIIGEIPDWVNTHEVLCIRFNTRDSFPGVQSRITKALLLTLKFFRNIITINDDIYLIKPTTREELAVPRYIQNDLFYPEGASPNGQYQKNIMNSYRALEEAGLNPRYNYANHCPKLFNAARLNEIDRVFGLVDKTSKKGHIQENLYNSYYGSRGVPVGDFRAGFWKGSSGGDINTATILNHDEDGFLENKWILDYLEKEFPDKCPAEL